MKPSYKRAKSVQVYLKPGLAEDDLLLALWEVGLANGRPQQMFRDMLLAGYRNRLEQGMIPNVILSDPTVQRAMLLVGDFTPKEPPPPPPPHTIVLMQPQGHGGYVPAAPEAFAPVARPAPPTTFGKDSPNISNPSENSGAGLSTDLM